MECTRCNQLITPGMEISTTGWNLEAAFQHCPYCLQIIFSEDETSNDNGTNDVSVKRHEMRRATREKFVDSLLAESADGQPHCPVCDRRLNESDELILRSKEYFRCHDCGHDLATFAYRKEVYDNQRWLPAVFALGDLVVEKKCAGCCYFGAVAKACQAAFAWLPDSESKPTHQVANMLRRTDWRKPDCDWESCFAVKQYRALAGEALLLL